MLPTLGLCSTPPCNCGCSSSSRNPPSRSRGSEGSSEPGLLNLARSSSANSSGVDSKTWLPGSWYSVLKKLVVCRAWAGLLPTAACWFGNCTSVVNEHARIDWSTPWDSEENCMGCVTGLPCVPLQSPSDSAGFSFWHVVAVKVSPTVFAAGWLFTGQLEALASSLRSIKNRPLLVSSIRTGCWSFGLRSKNAWQSICAWRALINVLLMRNGVLPGTTAILSKRFPMGTTIAWLLVRVPWFPNLKVIWHLHRVSLSLRDWSRLQIRLFTWSDPITVLDAPKSNTPNVVWVAKQTGFTLISLLPVDGVGHGTSTFECIIGWPWTLMERSDLSILRELGDTCTCGLNTVDIGSSSFLSTVVRRRSLSDIELLFSPSGPILIPLDSPRILPR